MDRQPWLGNVRITPQVTSPSHLQCATKDFREAEEALLFNEPYTILRRQDDVTAIRISSYFSHFFLFHYRTGGTFNELSLSKRSFSSIVFHHDTFSMNFQVNLSISWFFLKVWSIKFLCIIIIMLTRNICHFECFIFILMKLLNKHSWYYKCISTIKIFKKIIYLFLFLLWDRTLII